MAKRFFGLEPWADPEQGLKGAIGLIAGSQTLHSRFKSVTDEIMKTDCSSFVYKRLSRKRWDTTDVFSKNTKSPLAKCSQTAKLVGPTVQMADK